MTIAGIIILLLSLGLNIILFCGVLKFNDRLQDACFRNQEDRMNWKEQSERYEAMLKNMIFRCQRCKRFVARKDIRTTKDGDLLCPVCYEKHLKVMKKEK